MKTGMNRKCCTPTNIKNIQKTMISPYVQNKAPENDQIVNSMGKFLGKEFEMSFKGNAISFMKTQRNDSIL